MTRQNVLISYDSPTKSSPPDLRTQTNSSLFSSMTDKIAPPTFTRKLKDSTTVVGQAGEMECKVSGSPPFIVSWYHDGEEVQSGPNCEVSFSDNSCTLRVPTLKLSDSGLYKCKAVNQAGSSETTASLLVKGQELNRLDFVFFCAFEFFCRRSRT